MHEWALAEGVIFTALKVAEQQNLKEITEIKIKLGQLQQMEGEVFEFALREIIQAHKPLLEKARIELEEEKAVLECRICGEEWNFEDAIRKLKEEEAESIHFVPDIAHVYVRCPECKSSDFEVVRGRGVWVDSIEGQ